MFKRKPLALAVAAALGANLLAVSPGVLAQQQPQQQQQLERVEVTGSRIKRLDAETASPVTVITREDIERSGLTTVSDVIRSIPADNNGSISLGFTGGFAAGSSGVALRGLSVNSTLVLLNGRRMATYGLADDGQRTFVDLNNLPLDAVERVEVLKDGASAIYGSDAIAGVVNIILRREYTGAEARAEIGTSQHGGGEMFRGAFTYGFGNLAKDKYNVFFTLEAQKEGEIYNDEREGFLKSMDLRPFGYYDERQGWIAATDGLVSGRNYLGAVRARTATGGAVPGALWTQLPGCPPEKQIPNGEPNDFNGTTNTGGCRVDFTNFTQIQPETSRANFYSRGTYDFSQDLQGFAEFGYFTSNVKTVSPPRTIRNLVVDVTTPGQPTVFINNPLMAVTHPDNPYGSLGQRAQLRFAPEALPLEQEYDNAVLRLIAGIKGTGWGWDYETALGYIDSTTDYSSKGFVSVSGLNAGLANGQLRIGQNWGLSTPAAQEAAFPTLEREGSNSVTFWDVKGSRELMQLAGGPLGLAVGGELRREETTLPALPGTDKADIVGLGYSAYDASRDVSAIYAELVAPLAKNFELSAALRWDHYSDYGNSVTPKVGFQWRPIPTLAFRGTYAEGFRAPGPAESGDSISVGFSTYVDPIRCPVTGSAVDCGGNFAALASTGNKSIEPEESKSYSLGLVFEPNANWNASVDFWKIDRKNEITGVDAASVLSGVVPGQVVRDDSQATATLPGPILAIVGPYQNLSSVKTSGIDFDGRFRSNPTEYGRFGAGLALTWLREFERTNPGGTVLSYEGTHGPTALSGNAGMPRVRALVDLNWDYAAWAVTARVNYVGSMKNIEANELPDCLNVGPAGNEEPAGCEVDAWSSVDLFVKYSWNKNLEVFGSIRNLFDADPSWDPQSYGGQNYNPTYYQSGAIGRFFTVGLKYKFK